MAPQCGTSDCQPGELATRRLSAFALQTTLVTRLGARARVLLIGVSMTFVKAPGQAWLRKSWGWALASAACASACWDSTCEQPPDATKGAPTLRILSYNVGNSLSEAPYPLRLRDQAYEDHVGARIRMLKPDVVFLQEVLPPTHCETFSEDNPNRTCFESEERSPAAQRLLGADYTVVCDANKHIECMGVRTSFGTVRSVAPGTFSLDEARTAPLPGEACDAIAGECNARASTCDAESSVSTIVVDTLAGKTLRLVHAHPTALGETCLQEQTKQAFALTDAYPAILAGDWNFDPTRAVDLAPASLWFGEVGTRRRFRNHSPYTSACRLKATSASQQASLDRIVTDFGVGRCRVWDSPTLDDGFDVDELDGNAIDHFAVQCDLSFEEL